MRTIRLTLVLLGTLLVTSPTASQDLPRALSFDARVACQQAIEEVYLKHRIWPDGPKAKPPLAVVVHQAALEAKVEDMLRKSVALAEVWHRPITGQQLQGEIARMGRHTQRPTVLQELWAALGNDAERIAECLARPALVDRLIQNAYATDARFHGNVRAQARAELSRVETPAQMQMRDVRGIYRESEWIRAEDDTTSIVSALDETSIALSPDRWDELLGRLRVELPAQAAPSTATVNDSSLWVGRLSELQEDRDRFFVTAVLEYAPNRIRVGTVEWPKTSFQEWWSSARHSFSREIEQPRYAYELPPIVDATCADDTWRPTKALPESTSASAVWTGQEVIFWGGGVFSGSRYNPASDTWFGISATGAPHRRNSHSAVWTGTEMIVWGGCNTTGHLCGINTGGRYDPSTDTWTPTSTIGAPSARRSHAAVWTGTEMIVWGGCRPDFDGRCPLLSTGGVYDPSSDTWRPTTTAAAPTARLGHSTVWTGSHMIVWGGGSDLSPLRTGGRYDPLADAWTPTSLVNVPDERTAHSAIWTGAEMIVWGGAQRGITVRTGGRYDPTTDSWVPINVLNAPAARSSHSAIWSGAEMIVWGGVDRFTRYNSGGRYDPVSDTWAETSPLDAPSPRAGHQAVWTGELMVIWGSAADKSGGRYDPTTDTWQATDNNDAVQPRERHTAVWTGAEMIVWGGDAAAQGTTNTGGIYDPATDSWRETSISGAPSPRHFQTAVWSGTHMLVWGGQYGSSTVATGGLYDPITDSWSPMTLLGAPARRANHTAVWTGTEMIVWGGTSEGTLVSSGGRYDPIMDTWTTTSTSGAPDARYLHSAVWTGAEMIAWGGVSSAGHTNTGGRYDPSADAWQPLSVENAPAPRRFHTALWNGASMIVWGGRDGPFGGPNTYFDSGGQYDPLLDLWTPTSLADAPSPRAQHVGVWTGSTMVIWGGCAGSSFCNLVTFTGGRYDPVADTWTPTATLSAAAARYSHAAVWTGEEMIVWSGYAGQASTYTRTGGRYCVAPTTTATADLSIAQVVPTTVEPGAELVYTVVITNDGPGWAASVIFADNLPAETTFQQILFPDEWSCFPPPVGTPGGAVYCIKPSLAVGATDTFSVVANVTGGVPAGTVLINLVGVESSTVDPNPANNWMTATTTVSGVTVSARFVDGRFFFVWGSGLGETDIAAGTGRRYCAVPRAQDPVAPR